MNFKSAITLSIISISVLSCKSVKKTIANSGPYPDMMNWPDEYEPDRTNFFVHNEIEIQGSAEAIWNILIEVEAWPEWYEGAQEVDLIEAGMGKLEEAARFSWRTMGFKFTSTITEFEVHSRLSWESVRSDIRGYHTWLILPQTDGSCILVTEESQRGFLTVLEKTFQPSKLEKLHQIWLEELKQKVEHQALAPITDKQNL